MNSTGIPQPPRSGYTTTTEVPLYWAEYGPNDGERLVILHGGPGAHHDYLLPQLLALADRRALLFYDQRGGGRSRVDNPAPITWRDHVADLAAVLRERGVSPLTLIGYSWGGLLALLYLVESRGGELPAPVRLVLIDPAPLSRVWRDEFEQAFRERQQSEVVSQLRDDLQRSGLRERDAEAFRQRSFELSVAGYFADPRRAQQLTPFRVVGRVQQSVWQSLASMDLIPQLRPGELPALLIHGWLDPIPVESTIEAARAMRARLVVLEASGHVPYVEQPAPLFAAISRFLDDYPQLITRDGP